MGKEIKQQQQQQQEYPSRITSFLKLFSVKFQEVEKGNLQIKIIDTIRYAVIFAWFCPCFFG